MSIVVNAANNEFDEIYVDTIHEKTAANNVRFADPIGSVATDAVDLVSGIVFEPLAADPVGAAQGTLVYNDGTLNTNSVPGLRLRGTSAWSQLINDRFTTNPMTVTFPDATTVTNNTCRTVIQSNMAFCYFKFSYSGNSQAGNNVFWTLPVTAASSSIYQGTILGHLRGSFTVAGQSWVCYVANGSSACYGELATSGTTTMLSSNLATSGFVNGMICIPLA